MRQMEPPFYHVDRLGELSVGDKLDLNWNLEIYTREKSYTLDSQYEDQIRQDFPKGLSSHGVRYSHSFYEIDHNLEYYQQNPYTQIPTPVANSENRCELIKNGINEWLAERVRRDSFSEEHSRLQSYFAWPSEGAIDTFRDKDCPVFEVKPTDFDLRDMSLLNSSKGMSKYWEGILTAQPKLEVVMKGPVEVVGKL